MVSILFCSSLSTQLGSDNKALPIDEGFNIEDMSNKSRDSIAINLIDVDKPIDQSSVDALSQIDHVLVVRSINH